MRKKGRYSKATRGPWERSRLLRGSLSLEPVACSCRDGGSGSSSCRRLSEGKTLGSASQLFWDVWEEKGVPSVTAPNSPSPFSSRPSSCLHWRPEGFSKCGCPRYNPGWLPSRVGLPTRLTCKLPAGHTGLLALPQSHQAGPTLEPVL